MRLWALALVLLGGCHKLFSLDAIPADASGGGDDSGDGGGGDAPDASQPPCAFDPFVHDEDGDSVDDRCDACPTVSSSQLPIDTDGDGLPDACDPLMTKDRILFVNTFATAAHLDDFSLIAATWEASANGALVLTGNASVTTIAMHLPRRVVLRTRSADPVSTNGTLAVVLGQIQCRVKASNCGGSLDEMCVSVPPATGGGVGNPVSELREIDLRDTTGVSCRITSADGASGSSTYANGALSATTISIQALGMDKVVIDSIIVYGD